ncbi:MAG: hydrogenase maturation nickel metallochaperone HypA [Candidatus Bathyarchaeota archaeon]
MHEFSTTTQIVETVLREAKKHDAKKVSEVHLVIGKLTVLGIEQINFSYALLIKDTIMEHSKLYIEEKDAVVKCGSCGYEGSVKYEDDPMYHFSYPTLKCPRCDDTTSIVGGNECMIKTVKIVV